MKMTFNGIEIEDKLQRQIRCKNYIPVDWQISLQG